MVSVSSVQTLHIEHGVNSVLTPGSPLGTFHPMILTSLFPSLSLYLVSGR